MGEEGIWHGQGSGGAGRPGVSGMTRQERPVFRRGGWSGEAAGTRGDRPARRWDRRDGLTKQADGKRDIRPERQRRSKRQRASREAEGTDTRGAKRHRATDAASYRASRPPTQRPADTVGHRHSRLPRHRPQRQWDSRHSAGQDPACHRPPSQAEYVRSATHIRPLRVVIPERGRALAAEGAVARRLLLGRVVLVEFEDWGVFPDVSERVLSCGRAQAGLEVAPRAPGRPGGGGRACSAARCAEAGEWTLDTDTSDWAASLTERRALSPIAFGSGSEDGDRASRPRLPTTPPPTPA